MNLPTIVVKTKEDDNTLFIDPNRLVKVGKTGAILSWQQDDSTVYVHLAVRVTGPLAARAFYLDVGYDWVLGVDEDGSTVLVPLRIGEEGFYPPSGHERQA